MDLNELTTKVTELEGVLTETTKRADRAEAVIKLSAEHRDVFDGLSKEDQDKFLAVDDAGRKPYIDAAAEKLAKKDDPVEEVIPEPIRKRMDDLQKNLDAAETRAKAAETVAKAEQEKRLQTEFTKRAEQDYPNLPGTPEEKGMILKCLNDKLTEDEFKKVSELLRAGNAAQTQLGRPIGKDSIGKSGQDATWETIEKSAVAFAKESGFKGTKEQAVSAFMNTEEGGKMYSSYLETAGKN